MADPARQLNENDGRVYDEPTGSAASDPKPDLKVLEGGGQTSEPKKGHLSEVAGSPPTLEDISEAEEATDPSSAVRHKYIPTAGSVLSWRGRLWGTRKRQTIAGGGLLGIIISLIFGFSTLQGPLQFVHFAQLLQQFHFAHNQEFSDTRSMHVIINAINGSANRSRLGIVGNRYADKWESQLIKDTGLKPVYTKGAAGFGNRFAGFEVANQDLAKSYINDFEKDGINTRDSPSNIVDRNGKPISKSSRFVSITDENFRTKRSLVRAVGAGTDTTKIVSAIGSRLLIKRGGIDFHPLKNVSRKATDSLIDYRRRVKDAQAQEAKSGSTDTVPTEKGAQEVDAKGNPKFDANGNPIINAPDQAVADSSNGLIKEAQAAGSGGSDGSSKLKDVKAKFTKASGPALIIGVLCAVKAFGDGIGEYQYISTILPEMRIGGRVIATGNQVMSGNDVNLDELGALSSDFTDPSNNTSWTDARSIQSELGQPQTGPDIPLSAKPGNVGNKPQIFDILDKLGVLLKGTCFFVAGGFISHIPVLNKVASWGSDQLFKAIDGIISSTAGSAYTTQSLLNDALSIAAGQGVNLFAQGAELGNIANYGSKLAANDQAISTGGRTLSSKELAQLDTIQSQDIAYRQSQLSVFQRLFNPYDANTATAKLIDYTPTPKQFIASLNNLPSLLSSSFGNIFKLPFHKAAAASTYNYGFPEYGFSAAEQADPRFANPDENAAIVEPQLDQLNAKYGVCFSNSVTLDPSSSGIIIGTNTDKAVNTSDVAKSHPECNDGSEALLRYRFYLADAVTTASLSCYEGDENYCAQLGFSGSSSPQGNASGPTSPGTYLNPFHDMSNLVTSRIDEGVDYAAKAGTKVPVYAIGNGVVTKVAKGNSTFYPKLPNWITYRLNDGPASGKYVFIAEACVPLVQEGDSISSNTRLCDAEPASIETGWALDASSQAAAAISVYKEGFETAYGMNFNDLLISLGAPGGHLDSSSDPSGQVLGTLPAGWPTW